MDAPTKVSDAIASIEDLLKLSSPRDFSVEELRQDGMTEDVFGGLLDPVTRTFFFSPDSDDHTFYHEATHWVLINNGFFFRDKSVFDIFGWALDEVFAEFCANTLDDKIPDHVTMDKDEFRKNVLGTMHRRDEFKLAAGVYLLENDDKNSNVMATAAHLLSIPDIAYFSYQVMALEETFRRRYDQMGSEYALFHDEWKKRGNIAVERGVVGMIGERIGATLFEKGYRPEKILDEIRKETLLEPMQLYWQMIVPKLSFTLSSSLSSP